MVRSIFIVCSALALGGCGLIIGFEDHVVSELDGGEAGGGTSSESGAGGQGDEAAASSGGNGGDPCDFGDGNVWKELTDTHHCYTYVDEPQNWGTAKAICEMSGGHLATLTGQYESYWLLKMLPSSSKPWLGGSDLATEGTFVWVTGEPWMWPQGISPWATNQPDNNGDCLTIFIENGQFGNRGEFDDYDCSKPKPFYCERQP